MFENQAKRPSPPPPLPPKGEKLAQRETDGISQLPNEILSSIMSYCTVRDFINAMLVSKRWRHLPSSKSNLDFDWDSMFRTQKDCDTRRNCFIDICPQYKDRFVRGVSQFLQCNMGTRLASFRVQFCLGRDYTCDIDQWVNSAISMGVEELNLSFSCYTSPIYDWSEHWKNSYIFRYELLCHADAPKLQYLSLSACVLGPGVANQFSSLKSIKLARVVVAHCEVESIGSCFVNLESMTLLNCLLPPKLCIPSSVQRLKFLAVLRCLKVQEIELSATTLTSFEYFGDAVKFSFSRVPNLSKVYIGSHDREAMQYVLGQLAKDIPFLKALSVLFTTNKWVRCQPVCMSAFSKVKKLELSAPRSTLYVREIIDILKICPLLENLYLVSCVESFTRVTRGQPMVRFSQSVCKQLKGVHIGGFHFEGGYIELAIYLLENAASLEQMVIDPQSKVYFGVDKWTQSKERVTWDKGERERVWLQLKNHSKSSVVIM